MMGVYKRDNVEINTAMAGHYSGINKMAWRGSASDSTGAVAEARLRVEHDSVLCVCLTLAMAENLDGERGMSEGNRSPSDD